jgi:hypothetical protein
MNSTCSVVDTQPVEFFEIDGIGNGKGMHGGGHGVRVIAHEDKSRGVGFGLNNGPDIGAAVVRPNVIVAKNPTGDQGHNRR